MAVFIALAVVLVLTVGMFVLRPLMARALPLVGAVVLAMGVAAFGLYRTLGTPAALDPALTHAPTTLGEAVMQLEARMQANPGDAQGWRLLGQAYSAQARPADAGKAYAQALAITPGDADLLVEAAEARALAATEHRFDAQAIGWLDKALSIDPRHQRALWFRGIAQRQAGDPSAAARTWESLLPQVDAKTAASLEPQIDEARRAAGLPPLPASAAAGAKAAGITVHVTLDPDLAARARFADTAVVFVVAKAIGGPPMPVAVEKHALSELPLTVTLDDGDSPMPTQTLSAMQEVEVIARLSMSGNAIPQAGDLESQPLRVRLPSSGPLVLTIDHARP